MALRELILPWDAQPQEYAEPSQYWLSRGLKSLYILDSSRWKINQVTGRVGGASVGTGPTFPDGWLRTPGTANNGATLEHGLFVDIALPITLVVGWRRISGSVSWSLLDDITNWTGWYGGATGEIATTNSNSFNGHLTLGDGGVAFCHISAAELIGASRTGTAIDTSTTVPSAVSPSTVALGWARRGTGSDDNPAVAEFTHFAAIQGAVSIGELSELVRNPGLLFEPLRIWVPVSAGGGGNVTVALTGASVTASAGTLAVTTVLPLAGQSATFAVGTLTPVTGGDVTVALVGQSATFSAGTVAPSTAVAAIGLSATAAQGVFSVATSLALVGEAGTFAAGTLTASSTGGGSAALIGEAATFSPGVFAPSVTIALTGIAATMSAGILSASSGSATITVKAGSWLRYKKLS